VSSITHTSKKQHPIVFFCLFVTSAHVRIHSFALQPAPSFAPTALPTLMEVRFLIVGGGGGGGATITGASSGMALPVLVDRGVGIFRYRTSHDTAASEHSWWSTTEVHMRGLILRRVAHW
jgi:hypothetical protein